MDQNLLTCGVDESVATIALNRPDRMNTLNRALLAELLDVLEELSSNDDVRVVILTGTGRAFSAGGDLSAGLLEVNGPPPLIAQRRRLRGFNEVSTLLHDGGFVSVAAINGAAAGAGLSLALACDFRIAADTAAFNTAFLTAGVSGDFGGAWFATKIVGPAQARRLFLRPQKFDAATALKIGLVERVVPRDALLQESAALAAELATMAPLALRAMKANLKDAEQLRLADYLDLEAARHARCVGSADAEEAARAYLERRPPNFTGR